jgi:hypothetical protein
MTGISGISDPDRLLLLLYVTNTTALSLQRQLCSYSACTTLIPPGSSASYFTQRHRRRECPYPCAGPQLGELLGFLSLLVAPSSSGRTTGESWGEIRARYRPIWHGFGAVGMTQCLIQYRAKGHGPAGPHLRPPRSGSSTRAEPPGGRSGPAKRLERGPC